MKEKLLQYIWQFQYFNTQQMALTNGEELRIIHPGKTNQNQGPDFLDAKIKLNDTVWAGNIELHIRSSDWNLHKHSKDKNYNNIILHVVWFHDIKTTDINGSELCTLEIHNRVSKILLRTYETLMNSYNFIPCEQQSIIPDHLKIVSWKTRLVAERLEKKAAVIFTLLNQNKYHWEETMWWLISKNLGYSVNGEQFEKMARSVPLSLLAKHRCNQEQLEALLFGQSGLLEGRFKEEYPLMLQREYHFLKTKYGLQEVNGSLFFLRMRPASFPTIRIAQLAALVQASHHLFSQVINAGTVFEIKKLFSISINSYWDDHYRFDEKSIHCKKKIGDQMISSVIINTLIPVVFAYGMFHDEQSYKDKAIKWLEKMSPENNFIIKGFKQLKFPTNSAFDSQAYLQLKNEYCNQKRCLECAIGNHILSEPR
ncbi:MAG: DUF2851 family protein [Ginsengibacter sp.]